MKKRGKGTVRGTAYINMLLVGTGKFIALKVYRQCPLVLLVNTESSKKMDGI